VDESATALPAPAGTQDAGLGADNRMTSRNNIALIQQYQNIF
jgi:hypothetical protein